jgi:hypothetical protein
MSAKEYMAKAGEHSGAADALLQTCERMQLGSEQRAAVAVEAHAQAALAQVYLALVQLDDTRRFR